MKTRNRGRPRPSGSRGTLPQSSFPETREDLLSVNQHLCDVPLLALKVVLAWKPRAEATGGVVPSWSAAVRLPLVSFIVASVESERSTRLYYRCPR